MLTVFRVSRFKTSVPMVLALIATQNSLLSVSMFGTVIRYSDTPAKRILTGIHCLPLRNGLLIRSFPIPIRSQICLSRFIMLLALPAATFPPPMITILFSSRSTKNGYFGCRAAFFSRSHRCLEGILCSFQRYSGASCSHR